MLAFLDLKRTGVERTATDAMFYFRWQRGLQYGRPVKKVFLPWEPRNDRPQRVIYRSRRLARVRHDDGDYRGLVKILNFETGQKLSWALNEEGPTYIADILLSDRYVAVVTGKRYTPTT